MVFWKENRRRFAKIDVKVTHESHQIGYSRHGHIICMLGTPFIKLLHIIVFTSEYIDNGHRARCSAVGFPHFMGSYSFKR